MGFIGMTEVMPCYKTLEICAQGSFSSPGTAEALFGPGGVLEGVDGDHLPGEHGDGDHLGDLVAGGDLERGFAEVGHEDEDLASVACIDDAGGGGDAPGGHGGAVADQQAQRLASGGMARFNGHAGADAGGGAGRERSSFQSEEVVAEVFAGVGDLRGAGIGVQQLYTEHEVHGRAFGVGLDFFAPPLRG